MALTFIGLPFVVRTLQPVLAELGKDPEEAAATLGATRIQTLYRVVLPMLAPSLLTGAALALWLAPTIGIAVFAGAGNVFTSIAVFFSKMALVTFGGAYAVLGYVAQQAVTTYHWVTPGEMLDGLGMAETTPGR